MINVGAGTQTLPELAAFLRDAKALVVVITAPPEEVFLRQPVRDRAIAEFTSTEYTARNELNGLATLTVNVAGLGREAAARAVVDRITAMLEDPRTSPGDP